MTDLLDQADSLLKDGQYEKAIALLENIHTKFPNEDSVVLRLAWAFWDAGKTNRSIEYWEILLDRELQYKVFTGFAYDELVRIYKQEGQVELLIAVCEKAVRVQPEDVGFLNELGLAYLSAGQYEKACETFRQMTALEDDNPVFYLKLGEALLASGKPDDANAAFERAAKIDPLDADRCYFQAADLHIKAKQLDRAKRLLEKCLEIAPAQSLYHCALGDLLIEMGRTEDAFAAYAQACHHNRAHTASYYNRLGNSLMKNKLFVHAIDAFEAALSFDASAPCRHSLAAACKAAGKIPPVLAK